MYMEQVYVNMNNVRQRLNVEFNNVDECRNNVVKMTISKKNNKNHFELNATNSKFQLLFHNFLHFNAHSMHKKSLSRSMIGKDMGIPIYFP